MKREIRRKDRKISDEETLGILQKGEYGILSVCTDDNTGYGVPLSYAWVDGIIYFHCATEGAKLDFLRKNNKVSFCVVGKTQVIPSKFATAYESAMAFGTIDEVEGEEKRKGLRHLIKKYSADFIPEGEKYIDSMFQKVKVLRLSVEYISGKARKL